MTNKSLPSVCIVRELLEYSPETGEFFWKFRNRSFFLNDRSYKTWNSRFSGRPAINTKHRQGYWCGVLLGEKVLAHRVAWAIYHGLWPDDQVDHINGIKTDNRISNLRSATHSENMRNSKTDAKNQNGLKGVSFDKSRGQWMARIMVDRKQINLGRFTNAQDAHLAYCEAAVKYHGEFARFE